MSERDIPLAIYLNDDGTATAEMRLVAHVPLGPELTESVVSGGKEARYAVVAALIGTLAPMMKEIIHDEGTGERVSVVVRERLL